MERKKDLIIVALSTIIFSVLFHRQDLGLNFLVFEFLLIAYLLITKQFKLKGKYPITLGLGLILTSIFTVVTHSAFSYLVNILVLFLFIGIVIYPNTKSLVNTFGIAFTNILNSQIQFIKRISTSRIKGKKLGSRLWKYRIFIVPVVIIVLFVFIYSKSNPIFDGIIMDIGKFLNKYLSFLFQDFDFLILITLLLGLLFSNYFFIRSTNKSLIAKDVGSKEELERKRKLSGDIFRFNALKNEYRAGVFLLLTLNIVLLVLNSIDIIWVWFGFEWEGQYLKQFVHEGTYLLILSIIISVILVLYYFRRNLNFYSKNQLLKTLSYIWLLQNAILAISVAIRNFWYINYFSLAYKRIGVVIFLILTIYGLYTVFIKVKQKKTGFYLFKTNTYALLLVLIITSFFNWDTIIAKYNFSNSDKSFLHLNYMATLSDKSLPYLDKSVIELENIDIQQKKLFPFEEVFMTPDSYRQRIENRKIIFKKRWESKSILAWNLPEYLAYYKLFSREDNGNEN